MNPLKRSSSVALIAGLIMSPIASSETVTAETASPVTVVAWLTGFKEVPVISTRAFGNFRAVIDPRAGTITYKLRYSDLTGSVQQAHIHVGQHSVNGAVSVFLCQTEASADPTGLAPRCPRSGEVTGILQAANMVEGGIVAQGIEPGEFNELVRAIRSGVAYVNVHTTTFPAGEVRGQLHFPQ